MKKLLRSESVGLLGSYYNNYMSESMFNSPQMRLLAGLLMLMGIIALGSYARLNFEQAKFANPMPATISVSGEGEVLAVPDIGRFSFSVTAEAMTAAEAQAAMGEKVNAILSYLREQGIEDKDIKVENYNLYPKWRYEERVCAFGVSYCPPGERVQDGFEVTESVAVKVRDTAKAPEVIGGVGERGATNISNLDFTVDDTNALKAEARAKAIADANEKAGVLAKQLGVRVVRLASYYEENSYYEPYAKTMSYDMMAEEAMGMGGAELPVGEDSTTVRVNVTFEVQ